MYHSKINGTYLQMLLCAVRSWMVLVRDVCWSLRTHGRAISEANELAITSSSTEGLVPPVRELKCITLIFFLSANHDDMVDVDPH